MIFVTAAVITNKDKILITQRSQTDKLSLKWEFPGGKIEEGESPEACLKREIMEELNLDIDILKYMGSTIYKYKTGEINLIAYKAIIISGEIKLNVHNDARWVAIDELKSYDFAPADIELIEDIDLLNSLTQVTGTVTLGKHAAPPGIISGPGLFPHALR